ncbi:hypothetical protein JW979_13030 [bacterium]|nr:hypothetical protein [candidate division CSSED10-310 bacterium]
MKFHFLMVILSVLTINPCFSQDDVIVWFVDNATGHIVKPPYHHRGYYYEYETKRYYVGQRYYAKMAELGKYTVMLVTPTPVPPTKTPYKPIDWSKTELMSLDKYRLKSSEDTHASYDKRGKVLNDIIMISPKSFRFSEPSTPTPKPYILVPCPKCSGSGHLIEIKATSFGEVPADVICPVCHGSGTIRKPRFRSSAATSDFTPTPSNENIPSPVFTPSPPVASPTVPIDNDSG